MTITLRYDELCLELDPQTGGAITAFTWRGMELLRPVADDRLHSQHGRAVACYPLIPFANRIAGGMFSLDGRQYSLASNFGAGESVIHGNAWMHEWAVAERGATSARMVFDYEPLAGEWPFAYRAEQTFNLAADHLRIDLSIENRDTRAFPAGVGVHPYVARTPEATLRFEADTVWIPGADDLPVDRVPVVGEMEFADGRMLGHALIDACYAGWGGAAAITLPEHGLLLTLSAGPPLDHLQLYTPTGRDYFGLEPVSNMPDAINRMERDADHGLLVLQPGEVLRAAVVFGVRITSD